MDTCERVSLIDVAYGGVSLGLRLDVVKECSGGDMRSIIPELATISTARRWMEMTSIFFFHDTHFLIHQDSKIKINHAESIA